MPRGNAVVGRVSDVSPRRDGGYARSAEPPPPFVTVTFEDGSSARLDMSEDRSAVWADVLDSMRREGLPAYVEVDPDTNLLSELLCPISVRVGGLTPMPSGDVKVELVISDARHYLRRTNPDFQELLTALEEALREESTVVVTETLDDHQIIDVRTLPNPPGPAMAVEPPPVEAGYGYAPVTPARAQELFDLVNARCCHPVTAPAPCIPFWYPRGGCCVRAHEMRRLMIEDGTEPEKIWIYGDPSMYDAPVPEAGLNVATYNDSSCEVSWGLHVAPILDVDTGSGIETYVIDPSMFDAPVPEAVWVYAQGDLSATVVHSSSAVFYRTVEGTESFDNDYSETERDLATYRNILILSSETHGPPPYTACYIPDIYIRDNLQDAGLQPLVGGGISRSPDINHYRQELVDPQATLGSAAAQARDDLFEDIECGQPNYVYVRLQNRGMTSGDANVDLYWMRPSTLPTPSSWNLLGSIDATSIAPGDFEVAGPLVWNTIPDEGHYCFVAVLGNSDDPKPDLSLISDLDEFLQLIRNSNNVTWKNFDVENAFEGGYMRFSFQIRGWPRISYLSDLELDLSLLPPGAEVELRILKRLTEGAELESLAKTQETRYHARYQATSATRGTIRQMPLQPSDCSEATVYLTIPDVAPDGVYEFAVLQRINGNEVGRITKRLIVGDHPFVANRRTREVHVANCEWVRKMSGKNKSAYRELELALKRGYNGCHYCLPEHDTDRGRIEATHRPAVRTEEGK